MKVRTIYMMSIFLLASYLKLILCFCSQIQLLSNHQLIKTLFQTRYLPRNLLFRFSERYCRLDSTQAFVSFSLPEVALKRWKANGTEKEKRLEIGAITTLNDSRCVHLSPSVSSCTLRRLFFREGKKKKARKTFFSIRVAEVAEVYYWESQL